MVGWASCSSFKVFLPAVHRATVASKENKKTISPKAILAAQLAEVTHPSVVWALSNRISCLQCRERVSWYQLSLRHWLLPVSVFMKRSLCSNSASAMNLWRHALTIQSVEAVYVRCVSYNQSHSTVLKLYKTYKHRLPSYCQTGN